MIVNITFYQRCSTEILWRSGQHLQQEPVWSSNATLYYCRYNAEYQDLPKKFNHISKPSQFTSPHRYGRSSSCTTSKITITSETSLIQERYWASGGIYRSANGPWAVLFTWYPKTAYTGNREMNVLKIPDKFPPPPNFSDAGSDKIISSDASRTWGCYEESIRL